MQKFLLLVLLACLGGFLYTPFQTTDRYAAAMVARDGKVIAELSDLPVLRESLKEQLRPLIVEYLRSKVPVGMAPARAQTEILGGVMMAEKYLDLAYTAENMQRVMDQIPLEDTTGSEFTQRGWRSPFVFVAVDNKEQSKYIFEFQGLAGWKLTRLEASRQTLRKSFLAGVQRGLK
jgi:hypothetical protein